VPSRSPLSKFPGRFARALALVVTIVAGTVVLVNRKIE
jgi:hypothetical protein